MTLREDEWAEIVDQTVTVRPHDRGDGAHRFARVIVPPPILVPRTHTFDFSQVVPGTLLDADGRGIGLTHRLSGTGGNLRERDENLRLDPGQGVLQLFTTRSDIHGQVGLATGEYLGIRLSDLGFTGREDFSITVTIPDIPGLMAAGQFGLYAGTRSNRNIRGGLISPLQANDSYQLFLVLL